MSNFTAKIWDRSIDQHGRPCWVDKHSGKACYALLDKGGLPLPHFFAAGMNNPAQPTPTGMAPMGAVPMAAAPMGAAPMQMAPVQMAPMQMVPMQTAQMQTAPTCPQSSIPIAIVGDKVEPEKPDKWTEYEADCGTKYYHNPAKNETTWKKPDDFDKQKKAGQPAPPTEAKPEKKKKCKCTKC